MSTECPQKKVHVEDVQTTAIHVGSQDTTMVGAIGSHYDLGSVSAGIPDQVCWCGDLFCWSPKRMCK